MNPSAGRQTSRNRDRAVARIESITARTAVVATIATVGFGGLAAFTYSGTPGATYVVDTGTTSVDGTTNDTTTTNNSTTNDSTSGLQAVPAPTASTRRAHVTSGGSGR